MCTYVSVQGTCCVFLCTGVLEYTHTTPSFPPLLLFPSYPLLHYRINAILHSRVPGGINISVSMDSCLCPRATVAAPGLYSSTVDLNTVFFK